MEKSIYPKIKKRRNILAKVPLWLLGIIVIFIIGYWKIATHDTLRTIFIAISRGLLMTLFVTLVAYTVSMLVGLIIGILQSSQIYIVSQFATWYIELMRGLPVLVILYYVAFVMSPAILAVINFLCYPLIATDIMDPFTIREFGFLWRGIIALVFAYSAFIAEIFRAGIASIGIEQIETAKSLGFTRFQMFFPIIFPQAVKNVFPALANELVAIVKDSALVSVLGVADITQIGKVYATSTFRFFETYNIVALLYLTITVTLSIIIRHIEKRVSRYSKSYQDIKH